LKYGKGLLNKDNFEHLNKAVRKVTFFNPIIGQKAKSPYLCTPKFWQIMFAVIKIAGQQFKVQEGQSLYVPHLEGKTGDKVEFSEVLLADKEGKLSLGPASKVKVKAEILGEVQGDKVISFKMKRRKGFRKKIGHRTLYTQIRINKIA
jgi:large subunit ribosomal protein L21